MGPAVILAHPFSNTIISLLIGAAQTSERQRITSLNVLSRYNYPEPVLIAIHLSLVTNSTSVATFL